MKRPRVMAFDCFGTVFPMEHIPHEEIRAYSRHVRQADFVPYAFPASWYEIPAHADAQPGIARLRRAGILCVTLSNGSAPLLSQLSMRAGIVWDKIIDLAAHRAYKPNNLDAYRTVEKETAVPPKETLLVTANPTFGDVASAAKIGMLSVVIRHGDPVDIQALADRILGPEEPAKWIRSKT